MHNTLQHLVFFQYTQRFVTLYLNHFDDPSHQWVLRFGDPLQTTGMSIVLVIIFFKTVSSTVKQYRVNANGMLVISCP